jgi:hypothetical protein
MDRTPAINEDLKATAASQQTVLQSYYVCCQFKARYIKQPLGLFIYLIGAGLLDPVIRMTTRCVMVDSDDQPTCVAAARDDEGALGWAGQFVDSLLGVDLLQALVGAHDHGLPVNIVDLPVRRPPGQGKYTALTPQGNAGFGLPMQLPDAICA